MENKNYSTVFEADLAYLRSLGDTSECKTEFEVRLKTLRKLGGDIQTSTPLLYEIEKKILDFLGGDSSLYDNIYFLRKAIAERQGVNTEGLQTIYAIAVASLNSEPVDIKYTITFKNYDGTILETQSLSLNEMPVYTGETPVRESDGEYNYTFNGWLPEISPVSGNAEYVAQFEATAIPVNTNYVTFTAEQANSTIGLNRKYGQHTLEYSTDTTNWNPMSTSTNITLANTGDKVYIRGILNSNPSSSYNTKFKMTGKIAASGNCNAIWNYEDLNAPLKARCGYAMFFGCTALTTAPELPATTLSESCYYYMFQGCTSLRKAPELPATELANYCYSYMFENCTSLTTAPELPATTLASNCYDAMFVGCSALTTAPTLPATELASSCYKFMFNRCTSLETAPTLPATTLYDSCYWGMFSGCSALTTAPELPVTKLAKNCYKAMFYNCTSLVEAPELPATTLSESCYQYMFKNCSSLTTAPELPATTLASSCYSEMFYACISLTTAPELPATTLASSCYQSMFSGCTKLTTAPELPATTLESQCYSSMFQNCSSLTTAPELHATTLASSCYQSMFYYCSNLNKITCLATDISATDCTSDWVTGVSSSGTFIKNPDMNDWTTGMNGIPNGWTVENYGESDEPDLTLPYVTFTAEEANSTIGLAQLSKNQTLEYSTDTVNWKTFKDTITITFDDKVYVRGILSADNSSSDYTKFNMTGKIAASGNCNAIWNYQDLEAPLKAYCGKSMFSKCAALTTAPELPATTLAESCYNYMFGGCTLLVEAPELPATTLAKNCYNSMFSGCTKLTTAPILPATTLSESCYYYMFNSCTSLVEAPTLPATTLAEGCYYYMFNSCTSLVEAPTLPATTLAKECYSYMFYHCTSITTAPTILPATTLANYCYDHMFDGCTSLVEAPTLPATELSPYCYRGMFMNCYKLNKITCLTKKLSATIGYTDSWLNKVSSTGTFIKNPAMNDWTTGVSGIPDGWTVEDYVG